MINKKCPCYEEFVFTGSGESIEYCIYNNDIDFDCDKCKATKQDKTDAIVMTQKLKEIMTSKRKRRQ
jgi:hypothetical protein